MKNQTARVHSFESFGTVDGPGLRFVIFFQGCHLSCLYCHNRDLWDFDTGTEYSVLELFEEVKKYRPFFEAGNGGVTASGGDPLMQAKSVAPLFRLCKDAGINTVLDTSGAIPLTPLIKRILELTDTVLLDIKEINDHRHRELTGISNNHTLTFAKYLAEQKIPTWIRYVVVPGITDNEEDCRDLAKFIKQLPNVEKLELLPFHKMGEFKWEELSKEYSLAETQPPSEEDMKRVASYFEDITPPVVLPS